MGGREPGAEIPTAKASTMAKLVDVFISSPDPRKWRMTCDSNPLTLAGTLIVTSPPHELALMCILSTSRTAWPP
jgi:hypothetical protein